MEKKFTIYIVEDDDWFGEILEYHLSLNTDVKTVRFSTGKDCIKALKQETPSLITIDYHLPDMKGDHLLNKIQEMSVKVPVVFITGEDNLETACSVIKNGATEYLIKNNETKSKIWNIVSSLSKKTSHTISSSKTSFDKISHSINNSYEIIGNSKSILQTLSLAEKASKVNLNITLIGDTGTGKELIARAIHNMSTRKSSSFIALNVAAIPKELIESELFGHEKGSFTGASEKRIGKFEEADGGTLFLDEIGEMDIYLQTKLLRVIQEKEITRLGSNRPIKTNTRIITATNKNLAYEVQEGNFRQDLYYRLLGLPIPIAPLKEREEDIPSLANYFLNNFCLENTIPQIKLSPEALKKLLGYQYPGNIRELKAIIELAAVMSNSDLIKAEDISLNKFNLTPKNANGLQMQENLTLKEYNENLIFNYLERYNNDINLVAKKLDIGKSTIYRLLKSKKEGDKYRIAS